MTSNFLFKPADGLSPQMTWWLSGALLAVILPHVLHTPLWVIASFVLLLGWRLLASGVYRRGWLPNQTLSVILLVLFLSALWLQYHTLFGRDAGVALLIILMGMKMLELSRPAEALLVCFLGFFLVITNFLFSQNLGLAVYMLGVLLLMTLTLISLHDVKQRLQLKQRLRLSATLLLQGLPLMLLFFIFFPRIDTPLWGLPEDVNQGLSGLSDNIQLGGISQLSLSDEVAFRVKFKDKTPRADQLYWRGPVLWQTDGKQWTTALSERPLPPNDLSEFWDNPIEYTITLEPSKNPWLFSLDLIGNIPDEYNVGAQRIDKVNESYQVLLAKAPLNRQRYTLTSYTDYIAGMISQHQYRMALRLPQGKHRQARALAQQWRSEIEDDRALMQTALQHFNQNEFYYTLTPESVAADPVDEFLFETREGFCEHYAVAFTVLMRAAGIPARVVTGYQGGQLNPVSDYFIIRQRDAHAWVEIWLEDAGWVRVDPTSAVAPERIQGGINQARPPTLNPLGFSIGQGDPLFDLWQSLRNRWDALNNDWHQWVLSYNLQRQYQLLENLGFEKINYYVLIQLLFALTIVLVVLLGLWSWWRYPYQKLDPAKRQYLKFCHKMAKRGLARQTGETPNNFATRISKTQPDLAKKVTKIVRLYVEIRYHAQSSAEMTHKQCRFLAQAVKRF